MVKIRWALKHKNRDAPKNGAKCSTQQSFRAPRADRLCTLLLPKLSHLKKPCKTILLITKKQVQNNARTMAEAFKKKGYKLISNGTDNHLILIDLRNKELTGKTAEQALEKANITLNKNMVPFDTESPFVTSGIRIGSPAMTSRGFGEDEFLKVSELIDRVLQAPEDESVRTKVHEEVI